MNDATLFLVKDIVEEIRKLNTKPDCEINVAKTQIAAVKDMNDHIVVLLYFPKSEVWLKTDK